MKKLNQSWRNQKLVQLHTKNSSNENQDEKLPVVPTRRRLGRFALVARTTAATIAKESEPPVGKTTHSNVSPKHESETADGRLPISFMASGSWHVDQDLLAEMDKVEEALTLRETSCNQTAKHSVLPRTYTQNHLLRQSTIDALDIDNPSGCFTIDNNKSTTFRGMGLNAVVGNKRKARKKENPMHRGLNTRIDAVAHDERLMNVTSPTSSPIDKRPKLNTPVRVCKTKKNTEYLQDPFPTKFSTIDDRKGQNGGKSNIRLSKETENDISFSPLLETPTISDPSDIEEEDYGKIPMKDRPKSCKSGNRKSFKSKVPLDVVETPKRSFTRKRHSPKNLMSPDLKISKINQNKLCSVETMNNVPSGKLNKSKRSPTVLSKKNSSKTSPGIESVQDDDIQKQTETDKKHMAVYRSNRNESKLGSIASRTQLESHHVNSNISPPKAFAAVSPNQNSFTSANASVNLSLTEDKRLLRSWGLPEPVLAAYERQGVTTMFEWQAECLLSPSVLGGGNLIYSAPTSAGKTLVAEILVLKRVLETRKKAMIILPFVSVAREKMFSLQRLYQDAGIRVGGYMGSHSPAGGFSALDVAVCTIEKGNGLVNRMMEDGRIDDIGVVVVDELHMVGDSHRGYLLELMLTKLQFLSLKREPDQRLQIIGMSATLPNLEVLARWLGAALYRTDYRPVPLSEHIKVDNKILDGQLVVQGQVPARYISPDDTDHVLALCLETVMGGHSVLLFCPTKNWCEKLCETIARKFYQITHSQNVSGNAASKENDTSSHTRLLINKVGLRESIEQLRRCPVGVDPMLGRCLVNGVAYHHAGLTYDERDIVEGAFREGHLRVLVATSTLSSGVNLPARRVIIRTPMFHGKVIDSLTFKQMSGRAGRKGVDTQGESVLICKPSEKMKGKSLLQSELPPVESCLYFDPDGGLSRSLKRAILEVVVSGVTSSPEDVMSYIKCTLLSASMNVAGTGSGPCTTSLIENCIAFLQDNEFVSMQVVKKEDGTEFTKFFPTQLGSAILASSLSPDEGLLVFAELQKARRSFVLESELHVIYLVTPIYTTDIATSIDWYHYYTLWENLSPPERRVADLVGVSEGFIAQAIGGRINRKTEAQRKALAVHHRFYTALVLNILVREIPLMEVAAKFNINKGQLQSLQQSAATYTGMITVFCQRLGWHNLELILSRFQRRLSMGVQHELVDLVRISALTASTARMLYNAGYHSVADVARAEAIEVEELFKSAVAFQSDKKQEGETEWEQKERQKTKCIWLTGRKGMTEFDAAKEIIEEAKGIVQGDLGVKCIAWSSKVTDTDENSDDESDNDNIDDDEEKENANIDRYGSVKENLQSNNTLLDSSSLNSAKSLRDDHVEDTDNTTQNNKVDSSHTSRFTRLKAKSSYKKKEILFPYSSAVNKNNSVMGPSSHNKSQVDAFDINDDNIQRNKQILGSGPNNDGMRGTANSERKLGRSGGNGSSGGSHSSRKSRIKSQGKRRKSIGLNQSNGKEPSFFGQVVVTPPPGLCPLLVNDRNKSGVLCTADRDNVMRNGNVIDDEKSQNGEVDVGNRETLVSTDVKEVRDDNIGSIRNCPRYPVTNDMNTIRQKTGLIVKPKKHSSCLSTVSNDTNDNNVDDCCEANPGTDHSIDDVTSLIELGAAATDFKSVWKSSVLKESEACSVSTSPTLRENNLIDTEVPVGDSKNCSYVSQDLSFSESFVLDTQTVQLISAGCDADNCSPELQNHIAHDHGSVYKTGNIFKTSQNLSFPSSSLLVNKSVKKISSGPIDKSNKEEENLNVINGKSSRSENSEKKYNNADKHCMNSFQCFEFKGKSDNHGTQGLDSLKNAPSTKGNSDCTIGRVETREIMSNPNGNAHFDGLTQVDENLPSSFFESPPVSQRQEPGKEDDDVNDTDQPYSLLVASYERVSDFDEGMLECSGYDPEVNDSLSELNIVRDNPSPNLIKQVSSNTMAACEAGSESIFNPIQTIQRHNDPLSDTQCTDDSLLAAVDMGSMTIFSSSQNKVSKSQAPNNCHLRRHENILINNISCKVPTQGKNSCRNLRQPKNDNVRIPNALPSDPLFSLSLCDSLSASLVDQVFAQCEGIESSSPNNVMLKQHGQSPCQTSSTHATPVFPGRISVKDPDVSPVLLDNVESNPTSLNNSSCNGDGSDCVPPTPPAEASSIASPFKLTFLSPMRSKKKTGSVQDNTTRKELELKTIGKYWSENVEDLFAPEMNMSQSLSPGPSHLNTSIPNENLRGKILAGTPVIPSSQGLTQQSFTIIDVCAHKDLFQTFLTEWKSKSSFSLALACEKLPTADKRRSPSGIGCRFTKRKSTHSPKVTTGPRGVAIPNSNTQLVGMAVAWEDRDAYYISFMSSHPTEQDHDLDDSLAEPALCESITIEDRIKAVKKCLHTDSGSEPPTIQVYDVKTVYTTLSKLVGVNLSRCEDPRVADWLREPGCRLKNLHRMVTTYLPDELSILDEVGGSNSYHGLGCDVKSGVAGRVRACTESILTRKLMAEYRQLLVDHELWDAFECTEMPALLTLARMELNGFGVSMKEVDTQKSVMTTKLESLEQQAYKMAGHVFSLTSLDDIAKILYLELKLPLNGDPNAVPHLPTRGTRNRRTTVGGTSKEILEKLNKFHPLPALILEWRRVSSALTKSLFGLQRTAQHCVRLDMMRVFGDCQVFTATGRVSMAEPNIQNIPKDFCVEINEACGASSKEFSSSTSAPQTHSTESQPISMRKVFVPFTGGVILSADYSQLELRIIAHLSGDRKLIRLLNTEGGDVFKRIAAQFKSLEVEEVTATDRQQAKQVCYGMLYGIGPKALSEQIGLCEEDATVFMETFKATYPGVRKYLRETVEFCQKNGYVKTLFNRRRYLPAIKHSNPYARAQAERQAVNSSVQGSAADLVKKAMTSIDLRLMEMFPDTCAPHSQGQVNEIQCRKQPQGAFFLLQLHDELIYEVNDRHLDATAQVVKREMENAAKLCVRMPVKVNVGPSWGQLEEYNVVLR